MKTRKHNKDCKELQPMIGKDEGYICICFDKPQHTPTPWGVGKRNLDDNTIDIVAETGTQSYNKKQTIALVSPVGEWSDGYQEDNAEFIVRAVNSHGALLKACEAHRYAETLAGKVGYMTALDKARDLVTIALNQAIAKAEEKI
jgi:hypothetical protein